MALGTNSLVMIDETGADWFRQDGLATESSFETASQVRVSIAFDTDIVTARSKARELGLTLGLSHEKIVQVVTATSELARKIYQSGCPGVITLITVAPRYGVMVAAQSDGLGVPDNGPDLIRVLKLMDGFSVIYGQHEGMTIAATIWQ